MSYGDNPGCKQAHEDKFGFLPERFLLFYVNILHEEVIAFLRSRVNDIRIAGNIISEKQINAKIHWSES